MSHPSIDFDQFRLRRFVERLASLDQVAVINEDIPLSDLARLSESNEKASWFKNVGPQRLEIVSGVSASRQRIAAAFDATPRTLAGTIARRLISQQAVIEVSSAEAPVHERIVLGEDIDLRTLPFHLQHELDGGVYISSALDFTVDPATGDRNVGCRRLMLRGARECHTNLTNRSDLRSIYMSALERRERLPVSFVIGSHPADFMGGVLKTPGDEFALIASLRGAPLPMVKGVTNGVLVPADAEIVLEGYLSESGYCETDGPYGEFWGYYGPMHIDPLFFVTAITMRSDALHQTVLHGGHFGARMETNQITSVACELAVLNILRKSGIVPAAVYSPPGAVLFQDVRVALERGDCSRSKEVIEKLFCIPGLKHVIVSDADVDIFDDNEIHWATSTRFRADQDLTILSGAPGFYEDPTADAAGKIAKMGMDLTASAGWGSKINQIRPFAPILDKGPHGPSVRDLLRDGPKSYAELMRGTGSQDGRELVTELGELRDSGDLTRLPDGKYSLVPANPPADFKRVI